MEHLEDKFYMQKALRLAQEAFDRNEVPVGAILVRNAEIFSAHNEREKVNNPLGHAEIEVITQTCERQDTWRLNDATLYVTLEPCIMCSGLIYQTRIKRVVFACENPKGGALTFLQEYHKSLGVNHTPLVLAGMLADESAHLLKQFFSKKREK